MALHESEAIILQSYSLGEADRLVSFLSRAQGRVRGVAAGSRKPKSRFGATLERLSYVRIWYFEKENRELVRIRQCEIIESFLDAFRDYASSVALAILSEVTEAVLPDHEASDANFRLLLVVTQTIKRTGNADLPLAYFALWTVKLGGWLPALDRCGFCGSPLAEGASAYIARGASAVACGKCRRAGMRPISPAALALARKMLRERLDSLVEGDTKSSGLRETKEITAIMLDVIEQQIDRKLTSRELLEPTA
ncbi:MAG TPA: DNA repair protein RecO [Candidatus Dormibacteraeota bacterium]|nr:DNA repair protein RecO [Candidatus Dormibacteraeota bacterium]